MDKVMSLENEIASDIRELRAMLEP